MAEDYSDVVGMFPPEGQIAATRITQPPNPDAAAKAQQISKIVAVPPVVAAGDPNFWGEQARIKQARDALSDSPLTASWFASDPMGPQLAGDDIPALSVLASKLPTTPDPDSLFGAIGRGWSATEHHRAVADAAMGIGEMPVPLIPTPLLRPPEFPGAFPGREIIGNFIGSMASTVVHALPAAGAGAVTGGTIGAVGGAPGGPVGVLAGGAGGALAGGARGLALGIAADMGLTAYGSTYEETGTYRDGDGNALPESSRQLAAAAAGTGSALLALALPGASKETLAAGKALVQDTVAQAITRVTAEIGKIGLKGGLINAGFTAVQAIPEEIAKLVSSGTFDTVVNDPATRQAFIDKHVESFATGVALFGTLGVLTKGARAGYGVLARTDAAQLDSMIDAAQASKLKARSQEALTEFIRNGVKDDIGIASTADPAALAKIASPEAIQRAQESGADIHIPLSEYVAKVDPATHAALHDDIRFTPDGMTLREAAELPPSAAAEQPPVPGERLTMAEEQPPARQYTTEPDHEAPGQFVAKDETGRVVAVGDSPEQAIQFAQQREGTLAARPDVLRQTEPGAEGEAAAPTMQARLGGTREEALAQTRSGLYLDPLLKEPLPGMTQADWVRYNRLLEAQAARAAEAPEPLPAARAEIEAAIDSRREVVAQTTLVAREELRLNPDDVSPRQLPFLPKEILREGGMHPDDVAPTLGYRSGAEMVRELAKLNREGGRDALIDREINRLSYGDVINRALNSKQLDVLIAEARALGGPPITREQLRQRVAEEFGKARLSEATKKESAKGVVTRQGQLAESALLRNDMAAALVAKQRQAVAFEVARLQRGLEKEVNAFDRLTARYTDQKIVAGRDPEYTAHIQSLLAALGRPIARGAAELRPTLKGESLTDFRQKKIDEGRIISDPGGLPVHLPFQEWTVEDFRQLDNVIKSLDHSSEKERFFATVDKLIEVNDLVKDIQANLAGRQERVDPFNAGGLRKAARATDAMFLKMERLFDWVDKNDPGGPLNTLFRAIKEGQFNSDRMLREARAALQKVDDRAVRKGFRELVDNPFLDVDGKPMKLTRGNMIAMALNWGNRSNRDKLTGGFKWDRDAVDDFLSRNMTEAEWKFVQGIWDVFERFWPRADDVVRRVSGIGMDRVEALPIQTPFGTIRGGYYPIEYDPLRSDIAKVKESDLFQRSGSFSALPPAGHTKTRTGVVKPLRLDLDFIGNRLGETIHDIAYREALIGANKVLSDRRVVDAITRAYGPEYAEQIPKWLKYIANRAQTDDGALGWLNDLSRQARLNINVLAIGWNITTAMVHSLSAASNSIREVGLVPFGGAVADFFRNPTQMKQLWEWADSQSGELRNRKHNMDRDMQDILRQWDVTSPPIGLASIRQRFQLFAMSLIASLDKLSATPTWIAAHEKGLKQGMTDADAIYYADKVVRNAHGAGGLPDMAAVMRGPEALKWFTMFMTYFNHNYNQVRDIGRLYAAGAQDIKAGDLRTGSAHFISAAGGTLAYILFPMMVHELIKHGLPKSQQGETWAGTVLRALTGQFASMFPVGRDVADFALRHRGQGIEVASPANTLLDTMYKPLEDLMHATHLAQGPVSKQWVTHALTAPTAFVGVGLPNQLARAGQFLWDTTRAGGYHQYARTPVDWYNGLIYGQSHPKTQHARH